MGSSGNAARNRADPSRVWQIGNIGCVLARCPGRWSYVKALRGPGAGPAQADHHSAMSVPTPDTMRAIGVMAMAEHQA